jgi:hypothetical protein
MAAEALAESWRPRQKELGRGKVRGAPHAAA